MTQKFGLSSAMPSMNIAYRKAVDMKTTKLATGYSQAYQGGSAEQISANVRNSVPATRNRICGDGELQQEAVAAAVITAEYRANSYRCVTTFISLSEWLHPI